MKYRRISGGNQINPEGFQEELWRNFEEILRLMRNSRKKSGGFFGGSRRLLGVTQKEFLEDFGVFLTYY